MTGNQKLQPYQVAISLNVFILMLWVTPNLCFSQNHPQKTHFSFTKADINLGLLYSQRNLGASIVLKDVPSSLFLAGDTDEQSLIKWEPNIPCTFKYSKKPGNRQSANYPNTINESGVGKLTLNPAKEGIGPGIYYCILVSELDEEETSVEFKIVVQANVTPVMTGPLGRINLQQGAPLFRWDPVEGVPYYSLFLSEGQLSLIKNEAGEVTGISGLNLTWQAITPTTFLKYGDVDPGGNFNNAHVPPLLPGVKYNWIVLNSYGPGPDLISSEVAPVGPSEFEISRPTLAQAPSLSQPGSSAIVAGDQITFKWTPVLGVSRYRLFLYETADVSGSSIAYLIWSQVTSSNEITFEAKNLLVKTEYLWRVVAETKDGLSTSPRRSFKYEGPAGWVKFLVNSEEGPMNRVSIKIKTPADAPILLPAVTDTSGIAKLALPATDYSYSASRPGFLTTPDSSFSVPEDDTLQIPVEMARGKSTISGQVVDETGAAVFDAKVELKSGGNIETISTDATGYFSVTAEPGNWQLRSHKLGFIPSDFQSITLGDEVTRDIGQVILQKATNSITGRVAFADDNQPLRGAFVRAGSGDIVYETTTNNDGRFRFDLGPGDWRLKLDSQGFFSTPPSYSFDLSENQRISAPFQLFSGGLVNGMVDFQQSRVEGAIIKALDRETNTLVQVANTNIQGFYSLGLRAGDYWLEVSGGNFLQRRKPISIAVGQTLIENFTLTEAGFVSGTVKSKETSAPIEGAKIFVVDDTTFVTFSDSEGNYLLGIPPNTSLEIDATLPGFGSVDGPHSVTAKVGETVTQEIVLKALSGIITGVVNDGSLPIAGALVEIEELDLLKTTDGAGRFNFEIAPGAYTLKVSKECHLPSSEPVNLIAGVNRQITITLFALRSIITGKVTDIADVPIENALVSASEVSSPDDSVSTTITDINGNYKLCLNAGLYQITATQPGYLAADTTVVISDGDSLSGINFVLQDNFARVVGTVIDTAGSGVQSAEVKVTNEHQTLKSTTDADGSFDIDKIIPGASEIVASKDGFYGEKSSLFLKGQELDSLELILYPANGLISGRVRNSQDSTGIAGVTVTALISSGGQSYDAQTDGSGTYAISNLPVISGRTFQVFALKDGFFSPDPISNVPPNTSDVDFYLTERSGIISGIVLEEETAEPIEDVKVEASNNRGSRSSASTDSTGRFRITNLIPADLYNLTAQKSGFFTTSNQNIASGDTTVVITLARKFGFVNGTVVDSSSGQPIENIPIRATPQGQDGREKLAMTNAEGEYRLQLIADFYSIKPLITHHLSYPDSLQLEVTELDTFIQNFTLQSQTVHTISVRRVDSDSPDILNSEQPRFEATAKDFNGNEINIGRPIWSVNVSKKAAAIDSTGRVQLDPNYFGELIVTAADPKSGKRGIVDPVPSVFVTIDSTTDAVVFDDRGLQIHISPKSVLSPKSLTVSKAPVVAAKKGRAEILTTDSSFVIKPTTLVFEQPVTLTLQPPANSEGQERYIGKWNSVESVWDSLGHFKNNRVEAEIVEAGEYIAISKSKPTAIDNLRLLPNPFSPIQGVGSGQGLKIEFDLSSRSAPNPLFSVKIYNLEGNLVRLLHDQTPFPRGHSAIFWDGKTDNGTVARNGRYLVRLTLEDPSGQKDLLKSVVLIK